MKSKLLFITLLLLAGQGLAQVTTLPPTALSQLDRREQLLFTVTQDADQFGALLGDEYLTINADGQLLNKAQTLENIRRNPLPRADTILFSNRQQRVYANVAIRTGQAKAYKAGLLLADFLYTQTWLYQDNRWQLIGWQGTMAGWPKHYPVLITLALLGLLTLIIWAISRRRKVRRLRRYR